MAKKVKKVADIGVAYGDPVRLQVSELHDLQGDLKELSDESFAKLSKEIVSTGFAFAPHAWQNPKDKKWYLVDGHQRIKVVKRLVKDSGFRMPKIPVVPVQAKSFKEAKRRVLQAASQYGHMNSVGLFDFMTSVDLSMKELSSSFVFPTINLSHFQDTYFPDLAKVTFTAKTGQRTTGQAEDLEKFLSNEMRNLVFTYTHADHMKMVNYIDKIKTHYKIDNASDALMKFCKEHLP